MSSVKGPVIRLILTSAHIKAVEDFLPRSEFAEDISTEIIIPAVV